MASFRGSIATVGQEQYRHMCTVCGPQIMIIIYVSGHHCECLAATFAEQEDNTAVMYYQINIFAPGGARAAELHQANSQAPLTTNGNTTAVLWGPHDPHQDKVSCNFPHALPSQLQIEARCCVR